MNYRNFEILVSRFNQAHNFVGSILKIRIKNNGMYFVFAFAVDLMSVTKYNLDMDELHEKAIEIVKSKIDDGVFKDRELTYEYSHPNFIRVDDPAWWVKNK